MRTFSRHLPPLEVEVGRMRLLGKAILVATLAACGFWIYASPIKALLSLGTIVILIVVETTLDRRRTARLRQTRDDTICDFRRSFDVRKVDPWIIRATHEAFGGLLDTKQPRFPLRASDSIEDDLKIDWEDIDDLANEVAQRAGYDMCDCEKNPLYGKVKTVKDFVMFVTHQPKINKPNHKANRTS